MIRKKLPFILLIAGIAVCSSNATAQLYIDNATFFIQPGATVTVQGDVTSNVDIQGTGKVLLKGSSNQNVNMGGFTIPNLEVDNVSNATLTGNAKIGGDLLFTNGKLQLGNNNLTIANTGTISSAGSSKYVVTNGTGKLVKTSLGANAFTFPVGNTATSYNPVIITNSGTADDIAVRSLPNVLANGLTGTAFTKEVVDASWDITEAVANGSNLTVTAQWASTDELAGFNRAKTGISYYVTAPAANVGWDLTNDQATAASGSNPYTAVRSNVTTLGTFAVGSRPVLTPLLVSPKIFLQGAYNTGTGTMNDNLRSLGLLPTTEPYTGLGYIHSGSGGGETAAASVFTVTGNDAIVDWVLIQLHRSSDSVVISSRAALLQRDGDVVETDGVSPINIAGNLAGNYYISIKHRNHLGVRSASTLALAKTTAAALNFTTSLNTAYKKLVVNNAMSTLGAVYGLWSANANDDIVVKMTGLSAANNDYLKLLTTLGASTNSIPSTYSKQDLNMDGTVKMTGLSAANNDYLKLLTTLGASVNTVTQPTF